MLRTKDGLPIILVLLGSYLLVLIIFLILIVTTQHKELWKENLVEVRDKNLLIARNLTHRVEDYIDQHVTAISLAASYINDANIKDPERLDTILNELLLFYPDIYSVNIFVDGKGINLPLKHMVSRSNKQVTPVSFDALNSLFDNSPSSIISGFIKSPLSGTNSVLIKYKCSTLNSNPAYIIAELHSEKFEKMRSTVRFGRKGHAVLLDHRGHLVAHPNRAWADEMKDISDWPGIDNLLLGYEGITEFHSNFLDEDMIAAYAPVDKYGWGVLVPQSLHDIGDDIRHLLVRQLIWLLVVLMFVMVIAYFLAKWITTPLRNLSEHAKDLRDEQNTCQIQIDHSQGSPKEINELCYSLNSLFNNLQNSQLRQETFKNQIFSIVHHSPLLFLILNNDGVIVYAAGRLLLDLNLSEEEAIGKHLSDITNSIDIFTGLKENISHDGECLETIIVDSTVIELWCSSFTSFNSEEHIMIVGTDISDSKLAKLKTDLLGRVIKTEETERKRIAGELHDLLGQDLTAVRHQTYLILKFLDSHKSALSSDGSAPSIVNNVEHIDSIITGLQDVIRSMLTRLWPEALDNVGLVGSIRELVDHYKSHYDIDFSFRCNVAFVNIPDDQAILVYRVYSESLTNIVKHAKASNVELELIKEDNILSGSIIDNGIGFDVTNVPSTRYGVRGMKERIISLNGNLELLSDKNGTCITFSIPLSY